nr:hypothetical protein BHI3_17960 [Bacteriovorax sp. HI3]
MKKLMVALSIAAMSQASFAFDATSQVTAITAAEIILSTAVTVATSEAASISTSEGQKREAQKVLMEVQEYYQSGSVSVYLENKIEALKSLDESLSVDESVDLLTEASQLILTK